MTARSASGRASVHDLRRGDPDETEGGPAHVGGERERNERVEDVLVRYRDQDEAGDDRAGLHDVRLEMRGLGAESHRVGALRLSAHEECEQDVSDGGDDHRDQADTWIDLPSALDQAADGLDRR